MKISRACVVLCVLHLSMLASADEVASSLSGSDNTQIVGPPGTGRGFIPLGAGLLQSYWPDGNGFFLGIGGSYNSVKFNQNIDASGISNVYGGSTLVAYGQAGGPANPFDSTQTTFAPLAQIGFFRSIPTTEWFWGTKFSYKYIGTTFNQQDINTPQYGSFTNTGSSPPNTSFTGHVTIGSAQTAVNHELALMPFVGHSFRNSRIYFGAGPVVFATRSHIYDATGFADINGTHVDITGKPDNFSNSKWMWGGAAQVGMNFYFNSSWYLDLTYDFMMTAKYTIKNSAYFSSASDGYTDTGTLYVNQSQYLTVQSVGLSLNKAF